MEDLTLTQILDMLENAMKKASKDELERLRNFQLSNSIKLLPNSPPKPNVSYGGHYVNK